MAPGLRTTCTSTSSSVISLGIAIAGEGPRVGAYDGSTGCVVETRFPRHTVRMCARRERVTGMCRQNPGSATDEDWCRGRRQDSSSAQLAAVLLQNRGKYSGFVPQPTRSLSCQGLRSLTRRRPRPARAAGAAAEYPVRANAPHPSSAPEALPTRKGRQPNLHPTLCAGLPQEPGWQAR